MNAADLYISSTPMEVNDLSDSRDNLENCYPHDTDCLIILVPTSKVRESFMCNLLHRSIVVPIGFVVFLMTLVRMAQRGEICCDAFMFTWGIFLSQQFERHPRTLSEHILVLCILSFAFYAVMLMSTTIYTIVVTTNYTPEIDTLPQLIESGLHVYMRPPNEEDSWMFTKCVAPIISQGVNVIQTIQPLSVRCCKVERTTGMPAKYC